MATPSPIKPKVEDIVSPASGVKSSSPAAAASNEQKDASTYLLRQKWQRYAQSVIHADRTAEKAKDANSKEVGDAIIGVLRSNVDLRRTITYVEGKLTGQAQEMQALEGCMRSQPCVGRKRKRENGNVPVKTEEQLEIAVNKKP
jgi:hypothetical protein